MEAIIEILKYSFPLLGVFLGWLLTQLGEHFKVAREDTRRVKKTLFYLLEVRLHLSFFAEEDHGIRRYVAILRSKFSGLIPKEASDEDLIAVLSPLLEGALKNKPLITDEDLKNLTANYARCIESLSEIEPFIAFRLQGRNNVQILLNDLGQRLKVSISEISPDQNDKTEFDRVFSMLGPQIVRNLLEDLDEIILYLAKKVDKPTYKEAKKRLAPSMSNEDQKRLEEFTEKLLKDLIPPSLSK